MLMIVSSMSAQSTLGDESEKDSLIVDTVERVSPVAEKDSLFETMVAELDDSIQNIPQRISLETPDASLLSEGSSALESKWLPNPKKSLWLAIVFPGGGQIYNRKYWKLPLFYGGFIGCMYAINWNNTMYRDYSQAYIDIMDDDPNTKSYESFVPPSYVSQNLERLQELFRRKKDFYRRYRDLSIFCVIGVYALSIIDAYVDAELSSFDISPDLSMKLRPAVISDKHTALRGAGLPSQSYGVQCSFSF